MVPIVVNFSPMRYTFVFLVNWSPHRITASDTCVSTTWTTASREGEPGSDQRSNARPEFLEGLLVPVDILKSLIGSSLVLNPGCTFLKRECMWNKIFLIAIQNPMSNTMMKTGSPGHYTFGRKRNQEAPRSPAVT